MSPLILALLLDAGPALDAGSSHDVGVTIDAGADTAASYGLQVSLVADGAQPGEQIWLELTLRYDKSLAVKLPESLPDGRGMAPLGPPQRQPQSEGDTLRELLRFPFVLLAIKDVRSPAFSLFVGDDELKVPSLPLLVTDAGPSAEPPDPELAPMTVYRPGPAPWILPTLGALLLLILLVWGGRRWWLIRPESMDEPEEVIDAGAAFLELLGELRERLSDDPQELKSCWFELLEGLCVYLDRRFALRSAQSTTQEMLRALASARLVGFERVGLRNLLERADAVRYAKADPSREGMGDLFDQVEVWVVTAERAKVEADRR